MKYVYVLFALLFVFAACEPSDAAEVDEQAPTQPSTADEDSAAAAQEGDDEESLMDFFAESQLQEYTVSYEMESMGQEVAMTQYVDAGSSRFRVDSTVEGISSRTLLVDSDVIVCTQMSGSWSCMLSSDDEDDSFVGVEDPEEFSADDVNQIDGRVVAGTQTTCFLWEQDGTQTEQCFSPQGVPLYISSSQDGELFEVVATSYELSVPSNAFEPPAEPEDMESMYGDFDPDDFDPSDFEDMY